MHVKCKDLIQTGIPQSTITSFTSGILACKGFLVAEAKMKPNAAETTKRCNLSEVTDALERERKK